MSGIRAYLETLKPQNLEPRTSDKNAFLSIALIMFHGKFAGNELNTVLD